MIVIYPLTPTLSQREREQEMQLNNARISK